jgi:hypothetical protein
LRLSSPYTEACPKTRRRACSTQTRDATKLQIEQGQFTSSFVQNFVTVRFDKADLQKFVIGDSADGSGNVLFTNIQWFPSFPSISDSI